MYHKAHASHPSLLLVLDHQEFLTCLANLAAALIVTGLSSCLEVLSLACQSIK
jgi:hypothetical protein